MATAFNFIVSFWSTIDGKGIMTRTISDNQISMLQYFNNENRNLKNILDVLKSYFSSFGLTERGWKLPFTA